MAAQELTLPVPRSEVAITAARHKVISELRAWSAHVGAEVLEAVGLVVSELVTNAVQHVPAGPVSVTARLDHYAVAIEVTDSGTVLPRPVLPDEDEEHGRGLLLVAALSARHGSDRTQSGKCCWAEIPLHPAPGSPLPVARTSPHFREELNMPGDPIPEVVAIHPGRPLTGTVRVDGSKNAALPLLAAAAALRRPVQLSNVPANTDVATMLDLLRHAGWHVAHPVAEPHQVLLLPGSGAYAGTDFTAAARIRASYYLVPALLGLHGQARLPWPGGCRIGERGMELHFAVYEAFGDHVTADDSGYLVESQTVRTGPVNITFPFRSRGATIAAVLRAVVAGRPLRLGRPNMSPEVLSVIEGLALTGWGTQVAAEALVLEPVAAPESEGTVSWTVPGDKIEAGTLACAAAVTGGTVRIENVRNEDVAPIVAALADLGVTSYSEPTVLVVDARDVQPSPSPLRAIASLSPDGLDADFEPPLMALALTRPGTHLFADAINPGRHGNLLPQLARMGAEITELSPTQCRVTGPQQLQGAAVEATDIRTGSALMVAGIAGRDHHAGRRRPAPARPCRPAGKAPCARRRHRRGDLVTGRTRRLRRIVATTDVHSSFDNATPMLAHLLAAREDTLITDCGDFFEGSGYYQLAHGEIERAVLLALYDVVAPGNHGWPHYFERALHRITVCANAEDEFGRPLFRRWRPFRVGERRVAVTGVIGVQAFHAIPAAQRPGQRVTDPARALQQLMLAHHHEVDSWIVLSHSGFEEDLKLADACPFLDVVFAGHCHSDRYGPTHIGDTLVVKGPELATGYALAEPIPTGWRALTARFPKADATAVSKQLPGIARRITEVKTQLSTPLGTVATAYQGTLLDRRALLADLARRLHRDTATDAVVLNVTALRPARLGDAFSYGDLLAVEPFGNGLVHAHVPEPYRSASTALLDHLASATGPVVSSPDPLPPRVHCVLTTDYLAENYLGDSVPYPDLSLAQAVRRTLTEGASR